MIGDFLSDAAERTIRRRRMQTVLHLLVGAPLLGGAYGLIANLITLLIGMLPGPFSWAIWAAAAMVAIALGDLIGKMINEPAGDATNHGLTRVFAFRWVPAQERRLPHWSWEPWRTAFVAAFLIMMVANNAPNAFAWELFSGNPWVSSAIIGTLAALAKSLSTGNTWIGLLRRGAIAT